MLINSHHEPSSEWNHYRQVKLRLIVLLLGWIPFGVLIGGPLPVVLHDYRPTYVLAIVYMLVIGWTWLQYGFYPCPGCGSALRGQQFYRKTCPTCSTVINR